MTTTEPRDLELIRTTVRQLARKYDWEHWREKDTKHEYPWEFVTAFAEGGRLRRDDLGEVRRARPRADRGWGDDGRDRWPARA